MGTATAIAPKMVVPKLGTHGCSLYSPAAGLPPLLFSRLVGCFLFPDFFFVKNALGCASVGSPLQVAARV